MPESIDAMVESIGEIEATGDGNLTVELINLDLPQFISEVGLENILDEMKVEDINEYLNERAKKGEEDES